MKIELDITCGSNQMGESAFCIRARLARTATGVRRLRPSTVYNAHRFLPRRPSLLQSGIFHVLVQALSSISPIEPFRVYIEISKTHLSVARGRELHPRLHDAREKTAKGNQVS